jgi:dolichol-phosphate mannosyltransferase
MIEALLPGYDVIAGQRKVRRGETWFKKFTAWLFYRLMRAFILRSHPWIREISDCPRPCLNALRQMRETHRFVRGLVSWVGFPQIGGTV